MICKTCIFWDANHSWIEEIPIEVQYVADCEQSRVAHCRRHSPSTYVVPEPSKPMGFKILSLFPITSYDTFCGDYVEDESRIMQKGE